MKPRYITNLDKIPEIPESEREALKEVSKKYVFRVNDYYLGLIDWSDPADPIRQLVIPRPEELTDWGKLDASNEMANTPVNGVQHKYGDTALLLCNEVCGAYCRYCFRKRLFMNDNDEASVDVRPGLAYINEHPEISNVLLTGGDPLILGTHRLRQVIEGIREIPHVNIIRLGSKMPAFNPWRILDDKPLQELLKANSTPGKRIYLIAHFDHPRELTDAAIEGLNCFHECGVIIVNQCPLVKGINDDPDVLAELWDKVAFIGVPPYYLFQGRPTAGNEPYEVPIVEGYHIFEEAKKRVSGLSKRARYAMSHETGKIEIVGVDEKHIYLKYHRAKHKEDQSRFMVYHRNDEAYWLDQLKPVEGLGVPRKSERELIAEAAD